MEIVSNDALNVLKTEISGLQSLEKLFVSEEYTQAVRLILDCRGRVVVTGMGKSGIIGKKIAATLSSTGTPAFFLHPSEALHGDLGTVLKEDIFLALSNSGESTDVLSLLPFLKLSGNNVISLTGRRYSNLAQQSDVALVYDISCEGCPLGLAPMATTTASLVIGDCLAASLMRARGFRREDFARFHPGGNLGRRLLTRVDGLMQTVLPLVLEHDLMSQALAVLIETNLGLVLVCDENKQLKGVISDGDVKRMIINDADFLHTEVCKLMHCNPITVTRFELAETALRIMETGQRLITVLPVIDNDTVVGVLRMHDVLQAKIKH